MKHKYPVVGVKKAPRKSLAPFWGGVLAVMVLALVGAGPGPFNQAIVQAFGGPLNLRDATAGQVPVKQADGSWAPGAGGGGSGTVETLVPGYAIDVDDTDPANPIVGLELDTTDAWNGALVGATNGDLIGRQGGFWRRFPAGSVNQVFAYVGGTDLFDWTSELSDMGNIAQVGSKSLSGAGTVVGEGYRRRVYTYTGGSGAATTLTHSQSGSIICNTGATAETYVNLPTLDGAEDVGLTYTFDCTAASAGSYGLRFTAASGDTITVGTDTSASAGYVRTTIVNSCVTIYANSTSNWRAVSGSLGPWEVN